MNKINLRQLIFRNIFNNNLRRPVSAARLFCSSDTAPKPEQTPIVATNDNVDVKICGHLRIPPRLTKNENLSLEIVTARPNTVQYDIHNVLVSSPRQIQYLTEKSLDEGALIFAQGKLKYFSEKLPDVNKTTTKTVIFPQALIAPRIQRAGMENKALLSKLEINQVRLLGALSKKPNKIDKMVFLRIATRVTNENQQILRDQTSYHSVLVQKEHLVPWAESLSIGDTIIVHGSLNYSYKKVNEETRARDVIITADKLIPWK